ncbi:MAG: hypothetical protein ACREWG_03590, partial [Gammaproteobacteria bacterium]
IENAAEKTPLRRAIERKFKTVDEVTNLLDIMAARGMVLYNEGRPEPTSDFTDLVSKDTDGRHPLVTDLIALDGDSDLTLVQLDNGYYVVSIALRPLYTYDVKTEHSYYYGLDRQRIGFYPSCESMVDKIGWTEPLDSGRGALEFVTKRAVRRALCGAAVDGLQAHMGIVAGARGFVGGRNDYDRCLIEGQRRGQARARPLRDA